AIAEQSRFMRTWPIADRATFHRSILLQALAHGSPREPAARPAFVASPQGSTCLRQEIILQTWHLTRKTCPSSIGALPARCSSAVLPFWRLALATSATSHLVQSSSASRLTA